MDAFSSLSDNDKLERLEAVFLVAEPSRAHEARALLDRHLMGELSFRDVLDDVYLNYPAALRNVIMQAFIRFAPQELDSPTTHRFVSSCTRYSQATQYLAQRFHLREKDLMPVDKAARIELRCREVIVSFCPEDLDTLKDHLSHQQNTVEDDAVQSLMDMYARRPNYALLCARRKVYLAVWDRDALRCNGVDKMLADHGMSAEAAILSFRRETEMSVRGALNARHSDAGTTSSVSGHRGSNSFQSLTDAYNTGSVTPPPQATLFRHQEKLDMDEFHAILRQRQQQWRAPNVTPQQSTGRLPALDDISHHGGGGGGGGDDEGALQEFRLRLVELHEALTLRERDVAAVEQQLNAEQDAMGRRAAELQAKEDDLAQREEALLDEAQTHATRLRDVQAALDQREAALAEKERRVTAAQEEAQRMLDEAAAQMEAAAKTEDAVAQRSEAVNTALQEAKVVEQRAKDLDLLSKRLKAREEAIWSSMNAAAIHSSI